ncbi:hypothetical protein PSHT_09325 [Puccinia striiformis]|uniref:Uncharacterized protein n=1 Tax=Puccinia striiformis TaxID=27350 RepID=A0A2S4VHU3_9BASI|nr:hypothetical protein PSHT_09325 [Puccinia striiformis]
MVLQDKYKRATSSRYRATHGEFSRTDRKPNLISTNTKKTSQIYLRQPCKPILRFHHLSLTLITHSLVVSWPLMQIDISNRNPILISNLNRDRSNRIYRETQDPNNRRREKWRKRIRKEKKTSTKAFILTETPKQLQEWEQTTKVFIEDPNYQLQLEELDNERKKADATRAVINSILVVRRYLLLAMIRYPLKQPVLQMNLFFLDFLDEVLNDSSGTYGNQNDMKTNQSTVYQIIIGFEQ